VDLLEVLRTQSGPCDASKTIDEQDILHITGVLYAGRSHDGSGGNRETDPNDQPLRIRYF